MTSPPVFLDANVLVYALDESGDFYTNTVACIQQLLDDGAVLCTSHHVIEEVVHIARRVSGVAASEVVEEIDKLPGLTLVEPDATIDFAKRFASLVDRTGMGVNDALLLQLLLDAGIRRLFSYDKQFTQRAVQVGIQLVSV